VLAARAPGLAEALERALAEGTPYLILDGKVVDTDRCREKTVSRKACVPRNSACLEASVGGFAGQRGGDRADAETPRETVWS
jgi:hypothetical protein